ncbi:MAG TPA: GNAT family N-acetyltransferase [Micromonosporaceae bacterium]|nr:GNAT family N-acetyltransferase [Micromonosporaceae bacterium]
MELTWLDPDRPDARALAGAVAVLEAARAVDAPHELGPTVTSFTARHRNGWDGDPPVTAVAWDQRGRAIGVLEIWLGRWDNLHLGAIDVTVDPVVRRQGIGRQLFEAGVQRVVDAGRRVVLAGSRDLPAALAFAKEMGLDRAYEEVHRRQDVRTLDWARPDREYAAAQPKASGYEFLRISGAAPEDMIEDVALMTAAINDAPTDDLDMEDEVFTPERIRVFDAAQQARNRRMYRLVARERATGVLAGHTVVGVEGERPWHAWQYDTSVVRAHRGHRLGLLLKVGMLRWLAEEEPQLRTLDTENAASNAHMIGVNELLGYYVIGKTIGWQRHL